MRQKLERAYPLDGLRVGSDLLGSDRGNNMINSNDLEAFGYYDPRYEEEFRMQQSPQDMVEDYYHKAGINPDWVLCKTLIEEEYGEWSDAHAFNNNQEELKELADLAYVVFGYAHSRGWDLMEAFRRVHQNNLSRQVWDDGKIHRDANGKILKSPTAKKVDLSDLV